MKKIVVVLLLISSPAFAGSTNNPGGSGSGTVGSGTTGQVCTYLSSGTVCSGVSPVAISGDIAIGTTGISIVNALQGTSFSGTTGSNAVVLNNAPQFVAGIGIGTAVFGTNYITAYNNSSGGDLMIGPWGSNPNYQAVGFASSVAAGKANFYSGLADLNLYINVPSTQHIRFRVNDATIMDMTSSGLAIGTASLRNSAELDVNGGLNISATTMINTSTSFTNGAAAALGTLTNAPTAGNPTKWIPVNDNGTTRYIPAW